MRKRISTTLFIVFIFFIEPIEAQEFNCDPTAEMKKNMTKDYEVKYFNKICGKFFVNSNLFNKTKKKEKIGVLLPKVLPTKKERNEKLLQLSMADIHSPKYELYTLISKEDSRNAAYCAFSNLKRKMVQVNNEMKAQDDAEVGQPIKEAINFEKEFTDRINSKESQNDDFNSPMYESDLLYCCHRIYGLKALGPNPKVKLEERININLQIQKFYETLDEVEAEKKISQTPLAYLFDKNPNSVLDHLKSVDNPEENIVLDKCGEIQLNP
jgi:hypothetical protein